MRVHRGILVNKIPIEGIPGAIYMLQFLVWPIATPAVAGLYAALLAGGLLLAPAIHLVHRNEQRSLTSLRGGAMGFLAGLVFLASFAEPHFHFPEIVASFAVAGAGFAAWLARRPQLSPISIRPY
jgi:hypothetical protein